MKTESGSGIQRGGNGKIPAPSAFMRQLRPEYYSDSQHRTAYTLERSALEYQLETITARNETHDFEIFCRKLCERAICPNLRPQTGPEGGGDSKVDSETLPVADEIASLTYVGDASHGKEKWAFAFSSKKAWAAKVKSDVTGIVGTGRGYSRIICVTSQFAKAKTRADLEAELETRYGLPVTIYDRSWIVKEVIDNNRKDLAYNYLHVGHETNEARPGPADYSRLQQLEDIEAGFTNPDDYSGMERQRVTEALVAAKLSRGLEQARFDVEGRFQRAIRLADAYGTFRQKLEARYEWLWTAFWWFDDVALLNKEYDEYAALILPCDDAKILEWLSNLAQLLFNSVIHGYLSPPQARLDERMADFAAKLDELIADTERPNNALEAKTLLLLLRLNLAHISGNETQISELWPAFSEVLKQARGLIEYSAVKLTRLVEIFGAIAGNNPLYNTLVEETAAFVTKRTGDGEGGLILLKRGRQLDFDHHFEMIRILGRAASQLTKKEYEAEFIEAMQRLCLAYRSAGLLWAARSTCIVAISTLFIVSDEESELQLPAIPSLEVLAWLALELRHLPDFFDALQLLRGCTHLPLDDESKARLSEKITMLDLSLSSYLLNSGADDFQRLAVVPDMLDALQLYGSSTALLYALGYLDELRNDGSIPATESSDTIAQLYADLAGQPVSDRIFGPLVTNEPGQQSYASVILGMRVDILFDATDTSILVAEAVLGSLEAFFATAFELHVQPHTERLTIQLIETSEVSRPLFSLDHMTMQGSLKWPLGLSPAPAERHKQMMSVLIDLASQVMAWTCMIEDAKEAIDKLAKSEAAFDRMSMILASANSHNRVLNRWVSRLSDRSSLVRDEYPPKTDRPEIKRSRHNAAVSKRARAKGPEAWTHGGDHRDVELRSVINVPLWDDAGWMGVAYLHHPQLPPIMALTFTNGEAARAIFANWSGRFGRTDTDEQIYIAIVQGISDERPQDYSLLVSSKPPSEKDGGRPDQCFIVSRGKTMTPPNDANLSYFLSVFEQVGAYILAPAVTSQEGMPNIFLELGVMKRQLSLKLASEIGPSDLERMVLRPPGAAEI